MFFRIIDYIRRQPKAVREQYALWLTVLIVSSIGLIWLVMLPGRFANIGLTETVGGETARPFSQLLSQFKDGPTPPAEPPVASSSSSTPASTPAITLELTPETLSRIASSTTATNTPVQTSPRTVQITTTSKANASSSD